ncbi:FAD/NAD(P)-binding domain-containing protein [Agrocybe pediades]|nr:FAD/NAD(P)-binding domain-containing protein [Agrocybe pediades]
MDLNVWTSSTVICAKQNETDKTWSMTVRKSDGSERVFVVRHVIFAAGFLGGEGYIPTISGKEEFKGEILHSNHYQNAKGLIGKKVVVVGAGSAAHDICVECADYGLDVTMYQRSSAYVVSCEKGLTDVLIKHLYSEEAPPTPTVDFLSASMPILVSSGMGSRYTKIVAEVDRDILDGLHKRGFQTNDGYKGCGLFPLLMTRGGGCYIDIGGSQYIIDGKIKVKNGSQIREFFEGGLRFEDGTELQADVVVFCTGLTNASEPLRRIFGDHVADNAIPLWGLTEEGELSGCFRDLGFPGLYGVMGNIGIGRYYSKHLALQIKAVEEGILADRYNSHECTV